MIADLDEAAANSKENNKENLNTCQFDEHEEASINEYKEQIYQGITDKGDIEVSSHEEKSDHEKRENVAEPPSKDNNQDDVTEPISIDKSAQPDTMDEEVGFSPASLSFNLSLMVIDKSNY